jgi:hypothetical protein
VHAVPLDEPVAPPAVDVGDHAFRRVDLRRPRDRLCAGGWLVELQSAGTSGSTTFARRPRDTVISPAAVSKATARCAVPSETE